MKRLLLSTLIITCLFSCKKESEKQYSEENLDSLEVNDAFIDTLNLEKTHKK